jgi:hypothetical protein
MWKLESAERLSRWRAFRKSLNLVPLETAVAQVADFWTGCPYTAYYLDPDNPAVWPDPWSLIEENYWCDLAKSLGMLYTIKLTTHEPELEIRVYNDNESRLQYNLVWIDQGKYVLNMSDGEVVNKAQVDSLVLHRCYGTEELKLDSY